MNRRDGLDRSPARSAGLLRTVVMAASLLPALPLLAAAPPPPPQLELAAAPAGSPNVVVVMLDDVGFGAASTFGGPAPTPTLEALAQGGLRYNRFHTTGICSPTRAALMTGRNSHVANVGTVMNTAMGYPGYQGVLQPETATVAEVLRQHGYSTALFGKWHLVPDWEASQGGPFERWPTGQGFDTFYGFLGGETDSFHPTLHEGTRQLTEPVQTPDYHLSEDLAARAADWMKLQQATDPARPFFLYFAPGATHAPLQAPRVWIERFKGRFDQGWDVAREEIFARQQQLGVIPADATLTPRPASLPAWDSLSAGEQKVASRLMEIYAAFLAHTDEQVGTLVRTLKELDKFDNTLFIYIVGDNGASAEGGLLGSNSYIGDLQGLSGGLENLLARFEELGGPDSDAHYPAGWAWATNTPFQWMKQVSSHLGATRNPLVVSWPQRIRDQGGLRQQFSHVIDITPTILEAVGIDMPAVVNGVAQKPLDGVSLIYSFEPTAEERRRTQYFNVFGNRALYHEGWIASAFHGYEPWNMTFAAPRDFEEDRWELYNLERDFSQGKDLADEEAERLASMKALFMAEAARNSVLPLHEPALGGPTGLPSRLAGRKTVRYYAGNYGFVESAVPNVRNASHRIVASLQLEEQARGVVAAMGGNSAGWVLYLDEERRPRYHYRLFDAETVVLSGTKPLPLGPVELSYEFTRTGEGFHAGGDARLLVNGEEVARAAIGRTTPAMFTIHESFDVGLDSGSAVGPYEVPFRFSGGRIEHVDVSVN